MRIAILSDIHGNATALRAVLDDIKTEGGADAWWLLGDYVAMGPHPAEVLQLLDTLPAPHMIRGNTDRYMAEGGAGSRKALAAIDPAKGKPDELITLAGGLWWGQGAVHALGRWPWLTALPLEFRATLPDGTRVLCVHAAPGTDDGPGIGHFTSDDEIAALVGGCAEPLIFIGHTHMPLDKHVAGRHVVNPGSISMSPVADQRAKYVMLHADAGGHRVEARQVEYDRESVIADCERLKFPGTARVTEFLRGQRVVSR